MNSSTITSFKSDTESELSTVNSEETAYLTSLLQQSDFRAVTELAHVLRSKQGLLDKIIDG